MDGDCLQMSEGDFLSRCACGKAMNGCGQVVCPPWCTLTGVVRQDCNRWQCVPKLNKGIWVKFEVAAEPLPNGATVAGCASNEPAFRSELIAPKSLWADRHRAITTLPNCDGCPNRHGNFAILPVSGPDVGCCAIPNRWDPWNTLEQRPAIRIGRG